jgi:hypothetical protein
MNKLVICKLFLLLLLSFPYVALSQNGECTIDLKKYEYYIGTSKITNITFELTNICSEDVYVWIEKDSVETAGYNNLIRKYFFKTKGDFSFIQLIGENMSSSMPTSIYFSFIKKLNPNDKFFINVIYEGNVDNISELSSCFKRQIVSIKRSLLLNYFDPNILNDNLFTGTNLTLLSKYFIRR